MLGFGTVTGGLGTYPLWVRGHFTKKHDKEQAYVMLCPLRTPSSAAEAGKHPMIRSHVSR